MIRFSGNTGVKFPPKHHNNELWMVTTEWQSLLPLLSQSQTSKQAWLVPLMLSLCLVLSFCQCTLASPAGVWQLNISLGNDALFKNHYKTRKSCPLCLAIAHGKVYVSVGVCVLVGFPVHPLLLLSITLIPSSMALCFQDNSPSQSVSRRAVNPLLLPWPPSLHVNYRYYHLHGKAAV